MSPLGAGWSAIRFGAVRLGQNVKRLDQVWCVSSQFWWMLAKLSPLYPRIVLGKTLKGLALFPLYIDVGWPPGHNQRGRLRMAQLSWFLREPLGRLNTVRSRAFFISSLEVLSCVAHMALSSPAWHRNPCEARQRARSAAQVVGAKERRRLPAVSSWELRDQARFTMVLRAVVGGGCGVNHTPSTSKSTCWELFDKRQSGTAEEWQKTHSRQLQDMIQNGRRLILGSFKT